MTRILADLPDDEIKRLDQLAYEQGKSRAAILREAVAAYRPQSPLDWIEWQRRERASWTRPWDDDYEQVRAEFPDLFDAEDDRQRQIYLDMEKGIYPPVRKSDQQ
jgi:predicted transcriptional regulator